MGLRHGLTLPKASGIAESTYFCVSAETVTGMVGLPLHKTFPRVVVNNAQTELLTVHLSLAG